MRAKRSRRLTRRRARVYSFRQSKVLDPSPRRRYERPPLERPASASRPSRPSRPRVSSAKRRTRRVSTTTSSPDSNATATISSGAVRGGDGDAKVFRRRSPFFPLRVPVPVPRAAAAIGVDVPRVQRFAHDDVPDVHCAVRAHDRGVAPAPASATGSNPGPEGGESRRLAIDERDASAAPKTGRSAPRRGPRCGPARRPRVAFVTLHDS